MDPGVEGQFAEDPIAIAPRTVNIVIDDLRTECLSRELFVQDTPSGPALTCSIIEANPGGADCATTEARSEVAAPLSNQLYQRLERLELCQEASGDCLDFQLCEIAALTPGTTDYQSCLEAEDPTGQGWCYVDPAQGIGSAEQVANCPEGAKRKFRFVGGAAPGEGAATFFVCEGAPPSSE